MKTMLKIVMVIISASLVEPLFSHEIYFGGVVAIILALVIICELLERLKRLAFNEYNIDSPSKLFVENYEYYNDYNIPSEHVRYAPKTNNTVVVSSKSTTATYEDVINKCKINNDKYEIINTIRIEKKENGVFDGIKNLFKQDKEEKKSIKKETKFEESKNIVKKEKKSNETTRDFFIVKNELGVSKEKNSVYTLIIQVLKKHKYSTSKICRLLHAMTYINVTTSTVTIYTNERQLDNCDIIPKKEIIETFKKNGINVNFVKLKYVNIFDYFVKTNEV